MARGEAPRRGMLTFRGHWWGFLLCTKPERSEFMEPASPDLSVDQNPVFLHELKISDLLVATSTCYIHGIPDLTTM